MEVTPAWGGGGGAAAVAQVAGGTRGAGVCACVVPGCT